MGSWHNKGNPSVLHCYYKSEIACGMGSIHFCNITKTYISVLSRPAGCYAYIFSDTNSITHYQEYYSRTGNNSNH